jgi:hypothetical protein
MVKIILVGMSRVFYCTLLNLSNCSGSWVAFLKQNMNFEVQPPSTFLFWGFHKNGLIESCPSFDLPEYILWFHVKWWKFCIHTSILNFLHSRMVNAKELKSMTSRSPSVACPSTEFYKNVQIASKFLLDDTRNRQTKSDLSSLIF